MDYANFRRLILIIRNLDGTWQESKHINISSKMARNTQISSILNICRGTGQKESRKSMSVEGVAMSSAAKIYPYHVDDLKCTVTVIRSR